MNFEAKVSEGRRAQLTSTNGISCYRKKSYRLKRVSFIQWLFGDNTHLSITFPKSFWNDDGNGLIN